MTTNWSNISKPSGTGWTGISKPIGTTSVLSFSGGSPIGLLLALTQTAVSTTLVSTWTDVSKPTGTPWVNIPKAS